MRTRAELLAHIQQTNRQYRLLEIGKRLASMANRNGVAARSPEEAVRKSIEVDLAPIGHDDRRRTRGPQKG